MSWQLLTIDQFSRFHDAWNELNAANRRLPIQEARFIELCLKYFGDNAGTLAVYTKSNQCMAITVLTKHGPGLWQTFQAQQSPLGTWIHHPSLDFSALLQSLSKALSGTVLQLGITQQDPQLYARPPHTAKLNTLDYIDTAKISVVNGFDDYWSQRGKNLRQNMNRQRNRLQREEDEDYKKQFQ